MGSDTKLTSDHTVAEYEDMRQRRDRVAIADLIKLRLMERYIWTIEGIPDIDRLQEEEERIRKQKNGFTSMAVACLLIETLQSFIDGLETTDGESQALFQKFFNENGEDKNGEFEAFKIRGLVPDRQGRMKNKNLFYVGVRCGILHMGETTHGWKITRAYGHPIFDDENRRVHATKFLNAVGGVVERYCNRLKEDQDWDSDLWRNCIRKMDALVANCEERGSPLMDKQKILDRLDILRHEVLSTDLSQAQLKNATWGGAGLVITNEPVSDSRNLCVITRHSVELTWLIEKLKKIVPYDFESKHELFGRIGMAALRHQFTNMTADSESVLTDEEIRALAFLTDNDPQQFGAPIIMGGQFSSAVDFREYEEEDSRPLLLAVVDEMKRYVSSRQT